MPRLVCVFLIFSLLIPGSSAKAENLSCAPTEKQPASFSLDGVNLTICSRILSGVSFISPDPSNNIQIASAYNLPDSVLEFTVSAIPLGVSSSAESLPAINTDSGENTLRSNLAQMRRNSGGTLQDGPASMLFGRQVTSKVSTVSLPGAVGSQPALLTEWLVVAGKRVWIVRAAEKIPAKGTAKSILTTDLTLSSADLSKSSSSLVISANNGTKSAQPAGSTKSQSSTADLPTPAWWSGPCDTYNYHTKTSNKYYAFPLGASYRNVAACGPRHIADGGPDVVVRFFIGAWGEYEWECVELSMRFMYLAYGIKPYIGNGNQVVNNYSSAKYGGNLKAIINGTTGRYPVGGDILSYCATCSVGHTSVVTDSSVNNLGNGSVTIMEQNNSKLGSSTLTILNWRVYGNAGPIIGWLHPANSPDGNINQVYLPIMIKNKK